MKKIINAFWTMLDTAIERPSTRYPPPDGRTLGERLSELSPAARANMRDALRRWRADPDRVTGEIVRQTMHLTVAHELMHGCGVAHHEPEPEGPETYCIMRYLSVAQQWEVNINITTDPGWKLEPQVYRTLCKNHGSNCWESLRLY